MRQLLQLLEGDLNGDVSAPGNTNLKLQVTYKLFLQEYWPHFAQDLTKKIGENSSLLSATLVCSLTVDLNQIQHKHSASFSVRFHSDSPSSMTVKSILLP